MSELSPEAKKLFESAREAFTADEAHLNTLHEALQARLAAPNATATAATKASASLLKAKGAIGLGLAAAAVVTASMLAPTALRHNRETATAPSVMPPRAQATVAVPRGALEPRDARAASAGDPPLRAAVRPSTTPTQAAAEAPRSDERIAMPARLRLTRHDSASSAQTLRTPATQALSAPEREPSQAPPAAAPPQIEPAPAIADTLTEELALLRGARAALERGEAERALVFLDRHEERFEHGVLTQERLATRALALCATGQTVDARRTARVLQQLAPRSPHLMRLRSSCAWPGTPVE